MSSQSPTPPPPAPPSTPQTLRPTLVDTTPGQEEDIVDVSLTSSNQATPTGREEVSTAAALTAQLSLDEVKSKLEGGSGGKPSSSTNVTPSIDIPPTPPSPGLMPSAPQNTPLMSHLKESYLTPAQLALQNRFPQTVTNVESLVTTSLARAQTLTSNTTTNISNKASEITTSVRTVTNTALDTASSLTNTVVDSAASITTKTRDTISEKTTEALTKVSTLSTNLQTTITGSLSTANTAINTQFVKVKVLTQSSIDATQNQIAATVSQARSKTTEVAAQARSKTTEVAGSVEDVLTRWSEHMTQNPAVAKVITSVEPVLVRTGIIPSTPESYTAFCGKPGVEVIDLKPGGSSTSVYVLKPGQSLFYEFCVKAIDVDFSVTLRTQGFGEAKEEPMVEPKRHTGGDVVRGSIGCGEFEKCFCVFFDNSYGWRAKAVAYRCSVVEGIAVGDKVKTTYGTGKIVMIRVGGEVEVELENWVLAGGSKVICYLGSDHYTKN